MSKYFVASLNVKKWVIVVDVRELCSFTENVYNWANVLHCINGNCQQRMMSCCSTFSELLLIYSLSCVLLLKKSHLWHNEICDWYSGKSILKYMYFVTCVWMFVCVTAAPTTTPNKGTVNLLLHRLNKYVLCNNKRKRFWN